jgi:hypothetical protein
MKVCIWQAEFAETALGFNGEAVYRLLWEEDGSEYLAGDPAAAPESVWTRFQRVDPDEGPWPPEGYKGRSVSIGDVVEIDGIAWTPAAVGWDRVEQFTRAEGPVTVLDVALAHGARRDEGGGINGGEFDRLDLPLMGGCGVCQATIAAYNACPSTAGYLCCAKGCIDGAGFDSVAAYDKWELAQLEAWAFDE